MDPSSEKGSYNHSPSYNAGVATPGAGSPSSSYSNGSGSGSAQVSSTQAHHRIDGGGVGKTEVDGGMEKVDMSTEDMTTVQGEEGGLKRDLRLRHMVMIAISGTIGTGLFLTSGKTIATAGPLGALLAYMVIGVWLVFVCQAIGEIATYMPVPGAFTVWGLRVFDEAFSFQMTWVYFTNWALTIPAELSASSLIISFWLPADSNFPVWVVPVIIILVLVVINMLGVVSLVLTTSVSFLVLNTFVSCHLQRIRRVDSLENLR